MRNETRYAQSFPLPMGDEADKYERRELRQRAREQKIRSGRWPEVLFQIRSADKGREYRIGLDLAHSVLSRLQMVKDFHCRCRGLSDIRVTMIWLDGDKITTRREVFMFCENCFDLANKMRSN